MFELSVNEQDLLQRVQAKPELRMLFFRKVKGLKWFDSLNDAGYFNAQNLPEPVPAKQEGYVNIPSWEIGDYLTKTAPELVGENAAEYAPRFLEIISNATVYAKRSGFGNYRTWWQFAVVISTIPSQFVTTEFLDVVDYWLDDRYERGLVAEEIGGKWLEKLLSEGEEHSLSLAAKLLEILYKVVFVEDKEGEGKKVDALLRFDHYHADKITKKTAYLAGRHLGQQAVSVFSSKLEEILDVLGKDAWSAIWQPAIEDHDQNKYRDKPENVLVQGYRECLCGYLKQQPEDARTYVAKMIESPFQTIQRLAIYCISEHFSIFKDYADNLVDHKFLDSNYRHEIWHFFNKNYALFDQTHKDRVVALIETIEQLDEDGVLLEVATAYEKAIWLAAIKCFGGQEESLYRKAVAIAKTEPDHPDFSSYTSTGWGGPKSPFSVDELSALSVEALVLKLASYKGGDGFREPGIEGLSKAVKKLIKLSPSRFYSDLTKFADLDLAYVYSVLEAYSELWNEKANLPWDDIWNYLLKFCFAVVGSDQFWGTENTQERNAFVANRYWVVGAIGRLLESGAKSDDHSFHEKYHGEVERLLSILLQNESGEKFEVKSDAVSIAINSPRGRCIEALINLTLRVCRLSDRKNNNEHSEVWARFQHYYDAELKRAEIGEYEFSTLVTNYLPNFLYMSGDWVQANLERIFDKTDYLRWLCAIQGYSYVGTVYQEIYHYLSEHGDFLRVLDDENIKDRVEERVVQNIAIAYLNDFESLSDNKSMIRTLINRKDLDEISQLVWFVWTLRKDVDGGMRAKVYRLWSLLMGVVDVSTSEGRKLASSLCHWATFVDHIDDVRKKLLMAIAPYAEESHNTYDLLKSIASLSNRQPFEANEIWLKILEGSSTDYPEEAIKKILANLVAEGAEGERLARVTVSEYLKQGVEGPSIWLREIIDDA